MTAELAIIDAMQAALEADDEALLAAKDKA